jgi:nitrate/nitrite transporter NarK
VFYGPLVGALARPVGGWLADKIGGAKVTQAVFLLMMLAVGGVLGFCRMQVRAAISRASLPCSSACLP